MEIVSVPPPPPPPMDEPDEPNLNPNRNPQMESTLEPLDISQLELYQPGSVISGVTLVFS